MVTKEETIQNIITAYRKGAVIYIAQKSSNIQEAKSRINIFGPVNHSYHHENGTTIYIYGNELERIRVTQHIEGHVELVKDLEQVNNEPLTATRQLEIEELLIYTYKERAQFTIGYPVVSSQEEAYKNIEIFGEPVLRQTDQGESSFVIDDIKLQIEVIAIFEQKKKQELGIFQQYIDAIKYIDKSHYISLATVIVALVFLDLNSFSKNFFSFTNLGFFIVSMLMILYYPYVKYWATSAKWYNNIFITASLKDHIKKTSKHFRNKEKNIENTTGVINKYFESFDRLILFYMEYSFKHVIVKGLILVIYLLLTPILLFIAIPILEKKGKIENLQKMRKSDMNQEVKLS